MELPFSVQKKISKFLLSLPDIHDISSRKALLSHAGIDSAIQDQIVFDKPSSQFVSLLVTKLSTYGRLNDGRNALEAILSTAKEYFGLDKRIYCDALIQELRDSLSLNFQSSDSASQRQALIREEMTDIMMQASTTENDNKIEINISGGIVGNLNLGTIVGDITNNLNQLYDGENVKLQQAIETIVKAVQDAEELHKSLKIELIENLRFITEQALKSEEKRSKGVLKSIMHGISKELNTVGSLASIWSVSVPIIQSYFGIIL